jgi:hypothetical protein
MEPSLHYGQQDGSTERSDVAYWHTPEEPIIDDKVRSLGLTGRVQRVLKMSRLTQLGREWLLLLRCTALTCYS